MRKYTIGIDFGTLSGRALLVDVETGEELATDVVEYSHGVMNESLPDGTPLKPDWNLQYPEDYLDVLRISIRNVMKKAGVSAGEVIGIGIDFTACTMLPIKKEGTPLSEVQRLCDIHSALFHGATRDEQIANAEKAVEESLKRQKIQAELAKRNSFEKKDYGDKNAKAAALEAVSGHPLQTLTAENQALSALLKEYQETKNTSLIAKIREVSIHYAKKGDLLYPLLKVRYGVSGPSDVMWTVDDEIRDELGALVREAEHDDAWNTRMDAVLKRAEEMIYKEQNILFPICAVNFSEEEWHGIYKDSSDYAECFGVSRKTWEEAEQSAQAPVKAVSGEVVMPGGHLTLDQLTALLNTIPMEITFVDAENINRFFNEGPKVFKRPGMAIDREVFSCHPPKIEPMVRQIIDDFRNGRRDSVEVWMEKGGKTMLVRYLAVRDSSGTYLGTAECVQDMEFAKQHFAAGNEPQSHQNW